MINYVDCQNADISAWFKANIAGITEPIYMKRLLCLLCQSYYYFLLPKVVTLFYNAWYWLVVRTRHQIVESERKLLSNWT